MKREEIEELKRLAASMGLYDDKKPCKRAVILGKAIKELEQEPVLDKIRAEIEQMIEWHDCPAENDGGYDYCFCQALSTVLLIIDKYRAESEVRDE